MDGIRIELLQVCIMCGGLKTTGICSGKPCSYCDGLGSTPTELGKEIMFLVNLEAKRKAIKEQHEK
jgi:hypothetical protein